MLGRLLQTAWPFLSARLRIANRATLFRAFLAKPPAKSLCVPTAPTVSVDNLQESGYTGRSYAARFAPSANSYLPKTAPGPGSGRRVACAPGDAGCREPASRDVSTGSSAGGAAQPGIHRKHKGNVPRSARFA